MAVTTQGTAHNYGIGAGVGAITNATVLSFSKTSAHANVAETQNEIGNVIEWRADDIHIDATITIRPQALYTVLAPGATLLYETVTYIVQGVSVDEQNAGFESITYTLKEYEYITEA